MRVNDNRVLMLTPVRNKSMPMGKSENCLMTSRDVKDNLSKIN